MLSDKIKGLNNRRNHILFLSEADNGAFSKHSFIKAEDYDFEKILHYDTAINVLIKFINDYCEQQLSFWEEILKEKVELNKADAIGRICETLNLRIRRQYFSVKAIEPSNPKSIFLYGTYISLFRSERKVGA